MIKIFNILFDIFYIIMNPIIDIKNAEDLYKVKIIDKLPKEEKFDAIIVAVAHECFKKISISNWKKLMKKDAIIFDLKGIVPRELNPNRI